MKLLIDADGCPVVDICIEVCRHYGVECIIICDTSHEYNKNGIRTVVVEKGVDSVDFKLVNMIVKNDITVTQDYGLAAMCLAKGALVLNQDGLIYDDNNIGSLLNSRHTARVIRKAGGRLNNPKKRKSEQNTNFKSQLIKIIERLEV